MFTASYNAAHTVESSIFLTTLLPLQKLLILLWQILLEQTIIPLAIAKRVKCINLTLNQNI